MNNAILKPLLYFIAPRNRWNSDTGKWLFPCAHPSEAYNALGNWVDWHAFHTGKTANAEEERGVLSSKLETTSYYWQAVGCSPDVSACLFLEIIQNFLQYFTIFLLEPWLSYSLKIVWGPFCWWFAYSLGLGVRIKHTVLSLKTRTAFVSILPSFPTPGFCSSICLLNSLFSSVFGEEKFFVCIL